MTVRIGSIVIGGTALVAVAAVLGLALGLLYAWVINPVQWTDATPDLLRADYQTDYLKAAIDSYSVNRDVDLAVSRYQSLGAAGPTTLAAIQADPGEVSPAAVEEFAATVTLYPTTPGATPSATAAPPTTSITQYLLPVCGVTLVLGLLLGGVLLIRSRSGRRAPREAERYGLPEPGEDRVPYEVSSPPSRPAGLDRPPLATFRTTYTLGDDLYDDSFSIESATGDFLGECGVGIGDLIGVGHQIGVFGAVHGQTRRVCLLEGVAPDGGRWHLAGDRHQRRRVHQRVLERGDQVGRPRSRSGHDHTDPATGLGEALGHMSGSLFVSCQDVADRAVDQGVIGGENGAAGHPEHDVNPFVLEAAK